MVKKATQTLYTQHGIAVLFIGVICVCLLISIICMITNPLTKKRYQDVLEALKKKEHGYKINIEEFKDLLIIKKKREVLNKNLSFLYKMKNIKYNKFKESMR